MSSGHAMANNASAASLVTTRPPRSQLPLVGMPRLPNMHGGIQGYNIPPHAAGMASLNPANIPIQRGGAQAHPQQQV